MLLHQVLVFAALASTSPLESRHKRNNNEHAWGTLSKPVMTESTMSRELHRRRPPPTSYPSPTTLSTLHSYSIETSGYFSFPAPIPLPFSQPYNLTQTGMTIEPRPTPTATYPATMVRTVIIYESMEPWPLPPLNATDYLTFILHPPQPTDLPSTMSRKADIPCVANCSSAAAWRPDDRCTARGFATGCLGQCELKDGIFWCLRRYPIGSLNGAPDLALQYWRGKVCWWGKGDDTFDSDWNSSFETLGEPCRVGDNPVRCKPCDGVDYGQDGSHPFTDPDPIQFDEGRR